MGPYTQHQVKVICLQLFQELFGCTTEEALAGCPQNKWPVDPFGFKLHQSKWWRQNPGVQRWHSTRQPAAWKHSNPDWRRWSGSGWEEVCYKQQWLLPCGSGWTRLLQQGSAGGGSDGFVQLVRVTMDKFNKTRLNWIDLNCLFSVTVSYRSAYT